MSRSSVLAAAVVVLIACLAVPSAANTPIAHPPFEVHQVYPCAECPPVSFAGFTGAAPADACSLPGFFDIVPGGLTWPNYVTAALSNVSYTIKTISLTKTAPRVVQCATVFPAHTVTQSGTTNIRLRWPLMYEVPGTTWTLSITYGTPDLVNLPGELPGTLSYVHQDVWTWVVRVTPRDMKDLLVLFHELPFGTDEVPLISDEALYIALQAKLDQFAAAIDAGDTATVAAVLADFELEVMDACIGASPALPNPGGPGTGIANTAENPACCKLLADAEAFFMPAAPEQLSLTDLTSTPRYLWPTTNQMVPVNISYNITGAKGSCSARISSVKANEPIAQPNYLGQGGDYMIWGPNRVYLRASRSDAWKDRVYTVTVTASDSGGRTVSKDLTVTVPRILTGK